MNHRNKSNRCAPILASIALIAALILAGCTAPAQDPAPSAAAEQAPSPDGVLPADPNAPSRNVETVVQLPPPSAARTAPAATVELVGMNDGAIQNLLGKPKLVRREGPSQVWQYADGDCVLDLFLYRNDGVLRVAHFETRSRSSQQTAMDGCFAALISAAAGGSG